MGCYDGAEVCELVGAFALAMIGDVSNGRDVGLYHDEGLAVFRIASDRIRKEVRKIFQNLGLNDTDNLKRVLDFLDVTLDLTTGKSCPYRIPVKPSTYNHPELASIDQQKTNRYLQR